MVFWDTLVKDVMTFKFYFKIFILSVPRIDTLFFLDFLPTSSYLFVVCRSKSLFLTFSQWLEVTTGEGCRHQVSTSTVLQRVITRLWIFTTVYGVTPTPDVDEVWHQNLEIHPKVSKDGLPTRPISTVR